MIFTCTWGNFAYRVLPFGLCNALSTFQGEFSSIFVDFVHVTVEIYMDEFTPYCNHFQKSLSNMYKFLKKCIKINLSLSIDKCEHFMNVGIFLGHFLSKEWIQVDPNNIDIIKRVHVPLIQRDVISFLGLDGYYRRCINYFSKLYSCFFGFLNKESNLCWTDKF